MWKSFKQFAMKGNVMDMAIGVIIGGAFGKIVTSLVNDIIMPPIGWMLGGIDFSSFSFVLNVATEGSDAVTVNYGNFITTVINFLIIAASMFFFVRLFERMKEKEAAQEDGQKKESPTEEVQLLREIRDSLKQ